MPPQSAAHALAAVSALLLWGAVPAQAQAPSPDRLRIVLPPTPGLFAEGPARKQPGGPGTEAIRRLAATAGLSAQLEIAVGLRALVEAERRPATCATSARVPGRESLYRWVGPVGRARLLLYAREQDGRQPESLEALGDVRIGATRGSLPAAMLQERGLKVQTVAEEARNLIKLDAGQIDYWAANELTARYELKMAEGRGIRAVLEFGSVDIYLACHRDTPAAWLQRLNEAARTMVPQGGLRALGLPAD